jgi:uncharacterized protein YceH (UPF0502 family)
MIAPVLLSPEEGRVVGSLIEKQLTTPQQYPLTMNSLVLACNQSSNRDPVVDFDERTVDEALAALKTAGIVRFVYPSHGRSVTRYRQVLEERLGLDDTELALVGVLLLRGPQTAGELRSRTERMADFDGIAAVDTELDRLAGRPEPLACKLSRRPGQKEERWVQLLTGAGVVEEPRGVREREDESDSESGLGLIEPRGSDGPPQGRLAALEDEVSELRSEVERLRADLDDLRTQLGS